MAVKVPTLRSTETQREELTKEILNHSRLNDHKNIVKLIGHVGDIGLIDGVRLNMMNIVTELVVGYELGEYIKDDSRVCKRAQNPSGTMP